VRHEPQIGEPGSEWSRVELTPLAWLNALDLNGLHLQTGGGVSNAHISVVREALSSACGSSVFDPKLVGWEFEEQK
jgi:hypothetical protein